MRIVFMGTPDFGAASLRGLLDSGYDVVAVFTQPDRPRGRGMRLEPSPVKALAVERGIPVYQPATLRDGKATELLRDIAPDLLVVVAYGKILPEDFLRVARLGSINVHASLLPKYRGSAPIQWAVLNGDKTTGVSIQYMEAALDSGAVISSTETEIGEFETAGELFDRLMIMGADLLVDTVRAIGEGTAVAVPQDESKVSFCKMLDKSMSPIDWNRTPREIVKHICGLDPWPVATMELEGKVFRVFGAAYTKNKTDKAPGSIVSAGSEGIEFACADGSTLLITELQAPGKKRMSSADYLRGHPLKV
ncbi:MAG: methionyl-tRNA formyltransferase [Eubacteriales bacterium]|nr:methionyl-tRNA formyltransferase [Eubacteriales bacterium]